MAPQGVVQGSLASRVARRGRKRQSRHAGKTCKGCPVAHRAVVSGKLLDSLRTVDACQVKPEKHDADDVRQMHSCGETLRPVEAPNGELPGDPVTWARCDSKSDADAEHITSTKEDAGFVLPIACLETSGPPEAESGTVPCLPASLLHHDLRANAEDTTASESLCALATTPCAEKGIVCRDTIWTPWEEAYPLECLRPCRKRVHFNDEATTVHQVTPYAEIYGRHPRSFVFDRDSQMIPAARGGYVSASSLSETLEDSEEGDGNSGLFSTKEVDSCEDDGGWESWLREQENAEEEYDNVSTTPRPFQDPSQDVLKAQAPFQDIQILSDMVSERRYCGESEFERESAIELAHGLCLPALDDETGWESWLDATLGSTQDELFCDPM